MKRFGLLVSLLVLVSLSACSQRGVRSLINVAGGLNSQEKEVLFINDSVLKAELHVNGRLMQPPSGAQGSVVELRKGGEATYAVGFTRDQNIIFTIKQFDENGAFVRTLPYNIPLQNCNQYSSPYSYCRYSGGKDIVMIHIIDNFQGSSGYGTYGTAQAQGQIYNGQVGPVYNGPSLFNLADRAVQEMLHPTGR